MKKVCTTIFPDIGKSNEILKKMKLTLLILLTGLLQLSATSYSQATKLSFDVTGMPISEVLREIEEMSDFRFFYQREQVNVERRVTYKAENQTIDQILEVLFPGDDIEHKVYEDKLILLAPGDVLAEVEDVLLSEIGKQQLISITGTVKDSEGNPVMGVTVVVKSTGIGTITDADGAFSLQVASKDETLIISYVGMMTQEVVLAGRTMVNVVLETDIITLDEVIAIGYGSTTKKDITTYELATVIPLMNMFYNETSSITVKLDEFCVYEDNVRRHFKVDEAHDVVYENKIKEIKLKEFLDESDGDINEDTTT